MKDRSRTAIRGTPSELVLLLFELSCLDKSLENSLYHNSCAYKRGPSMSGFPGVARVNKVTPVSLGYPLSVFNKHSTLKGVRQTAESENRGVAIRTRCKASQHLKAQNPRSIELSLYEREKLQILIFIESALRLYEETIRFFRHTHIRIKTYDSIRSSAFPRALVQIAATPLRLS